MRRSIAVAAAALLSATGFAAFAQTAQAASMGAVVVNDAGCTLGDASANPVYSSTGGHYVAYNGGTQATCHIKGVANTTGGSVTLNYGNTGILCDANGVSTTVWSETISASGVANLTCTS